MLKIVFKLCLLEIVREERNNLKLILEKLIINIKVKVDIVAININKGLLNTKVDFKLIRFTVKEAKVSKTLFLIVIIYL